MLTREREINKVESQSETEKRRAAKEQRLCLYITILDYIATVKKAGSPQRAGKQSHLLAAVYSHLLMHSQQLLNCRVNSHGDNGERCN